MGNQASMVNSMADKLFLPADLVLDGLPPGSNSSLYGTHDTASKPRAFPPSTTGSVEGGGRREAGEQRSGGGGSSTARSGPGGAHRIRLRSPSSGCLNYTGKPGTGAAGSAQNSSGGGMGILAFEVASAMQRALDLWEQLEPEKISKLRLALQSEGVTRLVRSENALPWRLVALEIQRDLRVLRSIVIGLGKRGTDPRLHTLERRFRSLELGDGAGSDNQQLFPGGRSWVAGGASAAEGTGTGAGDSAADRVGSPEPSSIIGASSASPGASTASPLSSSSDGTISRSSSSNSAAPDGACKLSDDVASQEAGSGEEAASKLPAAVEARPAATSQEGSSTPGESSASMPPFARSPERAYPQSFLPKEEGFLLKYLEDMLSVTSTLYSEMSALDNLLPSSHPLRLSRMLRDLPPRPNAAGGSGGSAAPTLPPASDVNAPTGYVANALAQERIASQTKAVHRLQKESLWSESFDKCIVLLAAAVIMLTRKFQNVFGKQPTVAPEELTNTLWAAGLALHYSHTLILVDRIVGRPTLVLRAQRDELYQRLPSKVRRGLRLRLKGKHRVFDLEAAVEIRAAMKDMLGWMLPLGTSTIAWHSEHSYGCHLSRRPSRTLQVQTLHFADKDMFETLLVELLAGVSYFARPPGLTPLLPQEEASWKAWQSSGGDPKSAAAAKGNQPLGKPPVGKPGGGVRGDRAPSPKTGVQSLRTPRQGQPQDRPSTGAGAAGHQGIGPLPALSISSLWGEGIKKEGFSQALSAFGAAAKASYSSAFFGDKAGAAQGSSGPALVAKSIRPLGTGRKPSPAKPRPEQQPLTRQASF